MYKSQNAKKFTVVIVVVVVILFIGAMAKLLPPAVDWHGAFRPATLELIHGRSPYTAEGFYHAPWGLIPLIPLALLPEPYGRAVLVVITLVAYAFVAYRMGAKPVAIVFLLLSPPVLHLAWNGNLDWLAAIGFVLPPQWGLFFISVKPQMGIAVAPFWLIEAWRQGGYKRVLKVFIPFTVALLLSIGIFGVWPMTAIHSVKGLVWNYSLWPMSIPVGITLFVSSIRKRKIEYAIAASPCLSPYLVFHSWVGAILAIISSVPETVAAVVGMWVLGVFQYFSI